jgi:aryl sulfotransferase
MSRPCLVRSQNQKFKLPTIKGDSPLIEWYDREVEGCDGRRRKMSEQPKMQWPAKTREFQNALMDSTVWNSFKYREGDVVIVTWAKSGTTWTQQIATQLILKGADGVEMHKLSPWVDFRLLTPEALAALEQQTHRRVLKTHLPIDALNVSPLAKYIYVGRDGRDVVWSMHHHFANLLPQAYEALNNKLGRVGPPLVRPTEGAVEYFRDWLIEFGPPRNPHFWDHVRGWWNMRHLPNVRLIHFNALKADLKSEMRAISEFLDIKLTNVEFERAVSHCTFDYMKTHADWVAPRGGASFEGGAKTFINKGENGQWRDQLTENDSQIYEERARQELGRDCAAWLADGTMSH